MPCEKNKKQTCIYPCKEHCAEAAFYVDSPQAVASAHNSKIYGYDLIYVAHPETKKVFMFGNAEGFYTNAKGPDAFALHDKAFQQALKGNVVKYAWSLDRGSVTYYYHSTLLPLFDNDKKVANVLGLVRNLDKSSSLRHQKALHEKGEHTFSQILLAAREDEKREISKALHDEIGTSAVTLTSLLALVKDSVRSNNKKQALQDIARLDEQIKNTIDRVKNIIVNLRPPHLEALGLEGAARELLEYFSAFTGIQHELVVDDQCEEPSSDNVNIMLYRVIQEGLNNVVKHAHAKKVKLVLRKTEKNVTVKLEDDGVGFVPSKQRSIRHVGLLAMKDSAAYLGGTLKIKSEPGKGTQITVTCPRVVYGGRP
ncbi:sensor histidine kinase [Candidatus Avelusimicrobium aviculae]|uniref:sensor histidine kinase n=1 Tax=Candidatus Avelusimicrobium aviculae TaxID=3416206 RepID=UPI003D11B16C